MSEIRVLFLEHDDARGAEVVQFLTTQGHETHWVKDAESCRKVLDKEIFDSLIVDVDLTGDSTKDLVSLAKSIHSFGMVICLASVENISLALEALETGADAYIKKPFENREISITLHRLLEHRSLVGANYYLRRTQDLIYRFDDIIGNSPSIKKVLSVVRKVANSSASVLIEGETGTGKELIAGAIHYNSARQEKPFIKVNCAALQDTLLESELFGHEKGSFTGADKQRIGRFEQANFGTMFLDEIADMSPSIQAKVLRVLQEREFERVGGTKTIKVDVRVITATNKDLKEEITAKRFRDDLYYRLNVVNMRTPALRERQEDIIPLAAYFLKRFAGEMSKKITGFTPEAERRMVEYEWLGNIRELRNTIERAVLLTDNDEITPEDLALIWTDEDAANREARDTVRLSADGIQLADMEKRLVLEALERANWVQKEAARYLGVSRRVMHYKIQKFGITNPNWVKNK